MKEKDAQEVGFIILTEYYANMFDGPITNLFDILIEEDVFDYSYFPKEDLWRFAHQLDEYLNKKVFTTELFQNSLKMWIACAKKKIRLFEFDTNQVNISNNTGIPIKRIMEFIQYIEN